MIGSDIFIDQDSVKVRERCESKKVKEDDIVRFERGGHKYIATKLRVEVLNGVRCVVIKDMVQVKEDLVERCIREDIVTKTDDCLQFFENPIIDPNSIVSFKEMEDEYLQKGDKVEFCLMMSRRRIDGNIVILAEVNKVPSAILELTLPSSEIEKYKIGDIRMFKGVKGVQKDNVIVLLNSLQRPVKKICFCGKNNIFILDPINIKTCHKSYVENKMICFKSNGEKMVALLKWIGVVDGERVMGCEMRKKSVYGTNGRFGGERLFECEGGKGVLILVDRVEECCVNGRDKDLGRDRYRRVIGSSVCCVERVRQLRGKSEFKGGERVKNMKYKIFGICRWIGLVNSKEVVGVEVVQGCDGDKDEWIDHLDLFDCPSNNRGLFSAEDFNYDFIGLRYCAKNEIGIVDADKSVTGEMIKKTMMYKMDHKCVIMDLRWRGEVNGSPCVGCELTNQSDFGTDGIFGKRRLFKCLPGRGVLIPEDGLEGSCLGGKHKNLIQNDTGAINPDSICCVETLERLTLWSHMRIGSKITRTLPGKVYGRSEKTGKCKWMGLVNGKESVGVKMSDPIKYGTKGTFSFATLFKTKENKGALFLSEDIDPDLDGETLTFVTDTIVDITNLWDVKKDKKDNINGIKIGEYVTTVVDEEKGKMKILSGELKWIGTIMKKRCVGIDLEEEYEYGINGKIPDTFGFECPPRHGVVTTGDIERGKIELKTYSDGSVNADKYLRCEEGCDERILREKKVYKDGPVFVYIEGDDGIRKKKKGTLRWIGTMNGEFVAVVELDDDYKYGTNGLFWRNNIIRCKDKKAVGVTLKNISEYTPYEEKSVPLDERKFREIDINSLVAYYVPINNILANFYGTVKWSGENECGEYFYGLELLREYLYFFQYIFPQEDRYKDGTDGEFKGKDCLIVQRVTVFWLPSLA